MMRYLIGVLVLLATSTSVLGHEYWFEPDSFFLKTGEPSFLHLFVGQGLKKDEERPYQASKTDLFQMFSSGGTFDMRSMAEDGRTPVLKFSADRSGTYLLSMERSWSFITLEPDQFDEYLREDGMEYIIAERARLGESKNPGRERYSRYIKTLIQVGGERTATAKTRVGSRIEIVPLGNPYSKKVGESLQFQVYFGGVPLAGRTVSADNRDGDQIARQKLTTDKNGRITLKLDRKGVWLLRLVHMQRCVKACGEADWESFWGVLSFEVR